MNRTSPPLAWRCAFWLAGLIFVHAGDAAPLKLEMHALAMQPRTDAPEWIEAQLTSSSAQLIEGVLQLTALDDGATPFVYRTQELALTTGVRTFRLLLPASPLGNRTLDRELRADFFVKGGDVLSLGKFPLHTRLRMERGLVLAVGHTGLRTGENGSRLWQSLRLERFAPEKATAILDGMITSPVMLDPDDFPADPLVDCAFDAVLLEPGVFAVLKEKPREALGQWLAAGGSICLFATEPLDPAHVETLRTWLRADPAVAMPQFDADGRVQPEGDGLVLARVELGRLVVMTRPLDDPDAPAWRRVNAFLWKVNPAQTQAIEQEGHWRGPEANVQRNWPNASAALRSQVTAELTNKLLPQTVRVIPLTAILAILIGFIIAVGPLDYFVLGKFHARKFTWVLFPLVSIGFTVLTMKLAAYYLGTHTHRGTFIVTDLASDGRVLRETRCELILPAQPQEFTRDTQHALTALLAQSPNLDSAARAAGPVSIEGQYPAHYTLRFPLAQWTPQMIRVNSIGGVDESGINWMAFQSTVPSDAPDPAHMLQEYYRTTAMKMRGPSQCYVVSGQRGEALASQEEIFADFLNRMTFMPEPNPAFFTRSSPGGASSLEDLPLLETGDSHHVAIIAVRHEGDTIHAWRRVFPLP